MERGEGFTEIGLIWSWKVCRFHTACSDVGKSSRSCRCAGDMPPAGPIEQPRDWVLAILENLQGNLREFVNQGKLREFEIYSGNFCIRCYIL